MNFFADNPGATPDDYKRARAVADRLAAVRQRHQAAFVIGLYRSSDGTWADPELFDPWEADLIRRLQAWSDHHPPAVRGQQFSRPPRSKAEARRRQEHRRLPRRQPAGIDLTPAELLDWPQIRMTSERRRVAANGWGYTGPWLTHNGIPAARCTGTDTLSGKELARLIYSYLSLV